MNFGLLNVGNEGLLNGRSLAMALGKPEYTDYFTRRADSKYREVARLAVRAKYGRDDAKPRCEVKSPAGDSDGKAHLYIYDVIEDYWGFGAMECVHELAEVTADTVVVHLNSPGGLVYEGFAIYNTLRAHPARIEVVVEGLAASISSVIAMAGDEITVMRTAQVMIHDPWTIILGNAEEMRREAEVLDGLKTQILDAYVAKAGGKRDEISELMTSETFLSGAEALELGIVDIAEDVPDGQEAQNRAPAQPATPTPGASDGARERRRKMRVRELNLLRQEELDSSPS